MVTVVVTVVVARARELRLDSADGTGATESTANGARLALETVEALLATSEDTTLLLEVGHADSGKGRGGVVLGSVVVNLVDGDGGVDNGGLDCLWDVG